MSDLPFRSNKLVCIEYPAIVKNVDKMLETLGGEKQITETYCDPSHRLELRFRPRDVFCKPTFADRGNTTNLLMKVRRKKKPSENGSGGNDYTYEAEILGVVDTTYKFLSLVDFQYLPMKREGNEYKSVFQDLVPRKLEPVEWSTIPAPLFILPPLFSRIDSVGEYHFRRDPGSKQGPINQETKSSQTNIISRARQRRVAYAHLLTFEDKEVPTEPHPGAWEHFKSRFCTDDMLKQVQNSFEQRPIWSRNALLANCPVKRDKVKAILPVVAFYFYNGPWRGLWCRFNYDPRKDQSSLHYQLLDFRMRHANVLKKSWIKPKKSATRYNQPSKSGQSGSRVPTIHTESFNSVDTMDVENADDAQVLESCYKFRTDVIPPFRQMFYQFCDIDIKEIQDLLKETGTPTQTCHERYGWVDFVVQKKCRAILSGYVNKLKHTEEGSSKTEESNLSDESDADDDVAAGLENEMESELMDYLEPTGSDI